MAFKAHPDFSAAEEDLSSIAVDTTAGSILQKHQELRDVTDIKVRTLEAKVRQKDIELAHAKENFKTLTIDFEYNLGLIKERDEELEKYEEAMEDMKLAVGERDQESAELKVLVETLQGKIREEVKRFAEMEAHYQAQALQGKGELDTIRRKFESDIRSKDSDLHDMHAKLSSQRSELVEDATSKLQSQLSQSSAELNLREQTHRDREEKLQNTLQTTKDTLTATTLQLQLLEEQQSQSKQREVDLKEGLKEAKDRLVEQAADFETRIRDLQRDALATKHALEDKVTTDHSTTTGLQHQLEQAKQSKVDHEAEVSHIRAAYDVKVEHYIKEVADLKDSNVELRQQLRDEKASLDTMREEVTRLKEASYDASRKDIESHSKELNAMTIEVHKLRMELQSCQADNQSKKDLITSLHSELQTRKAETDAVQRSLSALRDEHASTLGGEKDKIKALEEEAKRRVDDVQRGREVDRVQAQQQLKTSEALRRQELARKDDHIKDLERRLKEYQYPHPHHHQSHAYVPHDLSSGSDYPPVSPLLGYQKHPHPNPNPHPHYPQQHGLNDELLTQVGDLKQKNKELVEQNNRIRAEVRSFAESMAAEPIMKKTKMLQEEVEGLRRELAVKKKEMTAAQAEIMDLHREAEVPRGDSVEISSLKAVVDSDRRKLRMYETLLAKDDLGEGDGHGKYKKKYEKLKHANHQLVKENKILRERMGEAKQDVKRLVGEKESLLDINNMMRGDLHKLAAKDITRHKATAMLPSKIVH